MKNLNTLLEDIGRALNVPASDIISKSRKMEAREARNLFAKVAIDSNVPRREVAEFIGYHRCCTYNSELSAQNLIDVYPKQREVYNYLMTH